MTIYLDMDGVLADFDAGARNVLGTDNSYKWEFIHGSKAFWTKLDAHRDFFGSLPKMQDADHLFAAVSHLAPKVLTALPKKDAPKVENAKRNWIARYYGRQVEVITCLTEDKPGYCKPGDILVDDRAVNRDAWNAKGGIFLLHSSAAGTIAALRALSVI